MRRRKRSQRALGRRSWQYSWTCLRLAVFFLPILLAAQQRAAAADVPEPDSYWMGPMQGDVPATLAHGQVIRTRALAELMARQALVMIDVAERPHRPEGLAADTVWKPASHRDIAGSIWFPGVGRGALEPAVELFFKTRLAALTKGDFDKPVVVYCHAHCWGSWNAAKRAISFGYRNIYWYPEGVEGWQEDGHELAIASDEGPVQASQ